MFILIYFTYSTYTVLYCTSSLNYSISHTQHCPFNFGKIAVFSLLRKVGGGGGSILT